MARGPQLDELAGEPETATSGATLPGQPLQIDAFEAAVTFGTLTHGVQGLMLAMYLCNELSNLAVSTILVW